MRFINYTYIGQLTHVLANSLDRVVQAQYSQFECVFILTGALTKMHIQTLTQPTMIHGVVGVLAMIVDLHILTRNKVAARELV